MNCGSKTKQRLKLDCDDVIVRQEILVSAMTPATWNCAIVVCHDVCMYLEAFILAELII